MPGVPQAPRVGLLMVLFSYLGIHVSFVNCPSLGVIGNRRETGLLNRVRPLMPKTATVSGLPGASAHTTNSIAKCPDRMCPFAKNAAPTQTGASANIRNTRAATAIIGGISLRSTGFFKKKQRLSGGG